MAGCVTGETPAEGVTPRLPAGSENAQQQFRRPEKREKR
jgi:hypothetical protein